MTEKLQKELNVQINAEMWSSNLYLSMAFYLKNKGLDGCANWLMKQSQEELPEQTRRESRSRYGRCRSYRLGRCGRSV